MRLAPGLGTMFDTPRARAMAGAFAVVIVGIDFTFALQWPPLWLPRLALGLIALLVAATVGMRDARGAVSLGLAPLDASERRWWTRVGLIAGGVSVVGLATVTTIAAVRDAPLYDMPVWDSRTSMFVWGGLINPVYEEMIYRLTLLPVCVALVGHRAAFAIGAVLFALLHVAYGNFDPSNAFGAIVLTWAFLRSGSLPLAIGLHAGGNLVLITSHVVNDAFGVAIAPS